MMLKELFQTVRDASVTLTSLGDDKINKILVEVAEAAIEKTGFILSENQKDLSRMDPANPMYDRLKLTKERIEGIAADTRKVSLLPSPLGRILKHDVLPNGLDIKRISVPFGVIGIVYEARPNVTFDVFSLCLKSGNACVLKGGKDADDSNRAIISIIKEVLKKNDVNEHIIELLPATHEATAEMLHANGYIDPILLDNDNSFCSVCKAQKARRLTAYERKGVPFTRALPNASPGGVYSFLCVFAFPPFRSYA